MIRVELPAKMQCDQPGCGRSEPLPLTLTVDGRLIPRPTSDLWQFLLNKQTGDIACRCPAHAMKVEAVSTPAIEGVKLVR